VSAPVWTIRQATAGELERLVDLRLAMFDAMGLLDEENRERIRCDCRTYFESTLPSEEFRVWVAVVSGADSVGTGAVAGSGQAGTCGGRSIASGRADETGIERGARSDKIEPCEGELVASIGLVVHSVPPSPFNRVGKEGYIMNLVTLPPWRRRGIAHALLSHVVEVLRAEGVPVVSLHASRDGRSLYEELGFAVKDELPEMRLSV
jgi:ribosomal protein S18 acetylase RimI-like enzyme